MKKVTTKKTRSVNNRPNCLKITKSTQKVNFTTVTDKDGKKIKIYIKRVRIAEKELKNDQFTTYGLGNFDGPSVPVF